MLRFYVCRGRKGRELSIFLTVLGMKRICKQNAPVFLFTEGCFGKLFISLKNGLEESLSSTTVAFENFGQTGSGAPTASGNFKQAVLCRFISAGFYTIF